TMLNQPIWQKYYKNTTSTANLLDNLIAVKNEAIEKMEKMINPGWLEQDEANGDKVLVRKIWMTPALSINDLEDCEVVLGMCLTFCINDITSKQIEDLSKHGKVIITDCHTNGSIVEKDLWTIDYDTSYNFMFELEDEDDEKKVLSRSFGHSE
ncbi:hypothetical protein LCGC14_2498530, partial [marine sediment metagenome]